MGRCFTNCDGNIFIEICNETTKYEYYHLISGMDLPLKSQKEIHHFFI